VSPIRPYDIDDLAEISSLAGGFMDKFSNSNVLVAGATGFVGSWIISSIDHMNRYHNTNIHVSAISRNFNQDFISAFPDTKVMALDISKAFIFDIPGPDCVFNAATPSSPSHGGEVSHQVLEAATLGTTNLIEICAPEKKTRFINLSSGIVTKRKNDILKNLEDVKNAYLAGKRRSEDLVSQATSKGLISGKNLRLYAFAGPGISLVDHFAVGNFMNDAVNGRPISIKGNPATLRSYLYPTDMIVNIFNCAAKDSLNEIEIGSHEPVSMHRLAETVNEVTGNSGIMQQPDYGPADEYIPKLGATEVTKSVSLPEALSRWNHWLR
jgi:nucleoside-diphosphate-sugar epimerase